MEVRSRAVLSPGRGCSKMATCTLLQLLDAFGGQRTEHAAALLGDVREGFLVAEYVVVQQVAPMGPLRRRQRPEREQAVVQRGLGVAGMVAIDVHRTPPVVHQRV